MPSDEKRRALIDLAAQLFMENGYEKVTVSDITSRLHWAKGLFYHFYTSKDLLLKEVCDELAEKMYQQIRNTRPGEDNAAVLALERTLRAAIGLEEASPEIAARLVMSVFRPGNVHLRVRLRKSITDIFARECNRLTAHGVQIGEMFSMYPGHIGGVALNLALDMARESAEIMLDLPVADNDAEIDADALRFERHERLTGLLNIYRDTLQRLVEAPFAMLRIAEAEELISIAREVERLSTASINSAN